MKKNYRLLAITDDWPRHPLWGALGMEVKSVAWALVQLRNERVRWTQGSKIEEILRVQARTSFPASYNEIARAASCSRRHAMRTVALLVGLGLVERVSRGNGDRATATDGRVYIRANLYRLPNWAGELLDKASEKKPGRGTPRPSDRQSLEVSVHQSPKPPLEAH